MRESTKAYLFGVFIVVMLVVCSWVIVSGIDLSGPILSERNPNGTIDYWYLFGNAENAP